MPSINVGPNSLLLKLSVVYADGSTDAFISDTTWDVRVVCNANRAHADKHAGVQWTRDNERYIRWRVV